MSDPELGFAIPKSKPAAFFFRLAHTVVLAIRWMTSNTTIERAQSELALKDAHEFIYQNSSIRTLSFASTTMLRDHCLKIMSPVGAVLEFGVYDGTSVNYFARYMKSVGDERVIYGFDSFEGFSEEWSGVNRLYPVNLFDKAGSTPKVENNVELVVGYIESSLPEFLGQKEIESVALIHIDTDTYSPAKTALERLRPFLVSGSIILFDEFCGYPNWRSHEYRALMEVLPREDYDFLGFASGGRSANLIKAAVRIK